MSNNILYLNENRIFINKKENGYSCIHVGMNKGLCRGCFNWLIRNLDSQDLKIE
jgi:hypothetical protein